MVNMKSYTADEAKRLILAKSIEGPYRVEGSLYLRNCDLAGVTLPIKISGSLDLRRCDLAGVTLPISVGGWLDLGHCENFDPAQWWTERGMATKRHCIAISNYALIHTDGGRYIAGCRGPWTAERALAHWGDKSRIDERARLFVKAIEQNEKGINQ